MSGEAAWRGGRPVWEIFGRPALIAETSSFLVVYKPPFMHSAPLGPPEKAGQETLLEAAAKTFPEVLLPKGRKACEGGLVHRLDFQTRGLVLIARTQKALAFFLEEQEAGCFVKEYEAVSAGKGTALPGFPPPPEAVRAAFSTVLPDSAGISACEGGRIDSGHQAGLVGQYGFFIESAFRPYGKGRKTVRPIPPGMVNQNGAGGAAKLYRTEILSRESGGGKIEVFRVRLERGFRHQIRCHLAWAGRPILNDSLYGGASFEAALEPCTGFFGLGLCAVRLAFRDPESGEQKEFRLLENACLADKVL